MRAHLGPADKIGPFTEIRAWPARSAGWPLPAKMSCTAALGSRPEARTTAPDRAAAGSVFCRLAKRRAKPRRRRTYWVPAGCFALQSRRATRLPPPVATTRRRRYQRAMLRAAVRNCQSSVSQIRRMSCSRDFRHRQPAPLPQASSREVIGCRRVPRRHVHSVGHMSDRHFVRWPARNSGSKRCRSTFSCSRLTPFIAPLPRIARYAMLKILRRVVGFCRPSANKSSSVMLSFCAA